MKRIIFLLILGNLLLLSCQNNKINIRLAEIDSLIIKEQYDSAYYLLNLIDTSGLVNNDDYPHFNLLKVQLSYLIDKPLSVSDSLLDTVISYYQKNVDNGKLADAFYYKAIGSCKNSDYQTGILLYKKAEQYAEKTDNILQHYNISEGISYVNGLFANCSIQLQYAKKTLKLSKEIGNKRKIAYSYFWLGYSYYNMEKTDSVLYYLDKTLPYINDVDKQNRPLFLSNIGYLLRDSNKRA